MLHVMWMHFHDWVILSALLLVSVTEFSYLLYRELKCIIIVINFIR